jgi:hypothetical protein
VHHGRRLCHFGERCISTAERMQKTCTSYPDDQRESLLGGEKTHAVFWAGLCFANHTRVQVQMAHNCLLISVPRFPRVQTREAVAAAPNQSCESTLPMPLGLARWLFGGGFGGATMGTPKFWCGRHSVPSSTTFQAAAPVGSYEIFL